MNHAQWFCLNFPIRKNIAYTDSSFCIPNVLTYGIVFISDFVVFIEYELNKKLQSAFCGIYKHLNLKKIETKLIFG